MIEGTLPMAKAAVGMSSSSAAMPAPTSIHSKTTRSGGSSDHRGSSVPSTASAMTSPNMAIHLVRPVGVRVPTLGLGDGVVERQVGRHARDGRQRQPVQERRARGEGHLVTGGRTRLGERHQRVEVTVGGDPRELDAHALMVAGFNG